MPRALFFLLLRMHKKRPDTVGYVWTRRQCVEEPVTEIYV